jgi:hypothetical protein
VAKLGLSFVQAVFRRPFPHFVNLREGTPPLSPAQEKRWKATADEDGDVTLEALDETDAMRQVAARTNIPASWLVAEGSS